MGWNELVEEQPHFLTHKQKQEGATEAPLTQMNQEVMDCLKDFIKYNPNLVYLDLQKSGLSEPILKHFGYILRRA